MSDVNKSQKDLINLSRENLINLREQILAKFQENKKRALEYFNDLNKVFQKYHIIKDYIKTKRHYYLNYSFGLFGYKYESSIQNANFAHFAAQAWLISAFTLVQDRLKKEQELTGTTIPSFTNFEESDSESFKNILSLIAQTEVEDNMLIQNIEILIQTHVTVDPFIKLPESRISRTFLKHINKAKIDILREINEKERVTREDFEQMIMNILCIALNFTLNDLNNENSYDLTLFEEFNKLKQTGNEFSFEDFNAAVNLRKHKEISDEVEETNISNPNEIYFYFASTSLSDLIRDVNLFNEISTSYLYKVRALVKQRLYYLKDLSNEYLEMALDAFYQLYERFGLEKVRQVLLGYGKMLEQRYDQGIVYMNYHYDNLKKWIDHSAKRKLMIYSEEAIKYANAYASIYKDLFMQTVYNPAKNLFIVTTKQATTVFLFTKDYSALAISELKDKAVKGFHIVYDPIEAKIDDIKKKIKVEVDENNNIKLEISKDLMIVDPKKVTQFIDYLIKTVNEMDVKEKYLIGKEALTGFVMKKYRAFLGLAAAPEDKKEKEKENEEKVQVKVEIKKEVVVEQ